MKKILSVILSAILLLSVIPMGAASAVTNPVVSVDSVNGTPGEEVQVSINLINNPGIISARFDVSYDSDVLEIVDKTAGSAYSGMVFSQYLTENPFITNWVDSLSPDVTADGVFATLTFRVKDTAPEGLSPITVSYKQVDIFNSVFDDVTFEIQNGGINVEHCKHSSKTTEKQNQTTLDCKTNAGYDSVEICNDCGAEISRTTVVTQYAEGHKFSNGMCTVCGESEFNEPTVYVSNVTGKPGQEVSVDVKLASNPGIISARFDIGYDVQALEIVTATGGSAFTGVAFGKQNANPFVTNWVDSLKPNVTADGIFVTITFRIKDDAPEGIYPITVSYKQVDVFNSNFEDVTFEIQNGSVEVEHCEHLSTKIERENQTTLDCTTNAGYDNVKICNDCGAEVSRTTVITQYAEGHKFGSDNTCTVCGEPKFNGPTVYVNNVTGKPGQEITVDVKLANNPGIISARFDIDYDAQALELVGATAGSAFSGVYFSPLTANPFITNWVDSINPDVTANGTFATLTFIIKEELTEGTYPITVSYKQVDVFNSNFEDVTFEIQNATVNVALCEHKNRTNKQENYVGATCTTNGSYEKAVYCNDCGVVVSREKYTINAKGHSLTHISAVAATCTTDGMQEYDECNNCNVVLQNGIEVTKNSLIIKAFGHTAGSVIVENVVEASCTTKSSHDNVVYCTTCQYEMLRNTVVGDYLHQFGNDGKCEICGTAISEPTVYIGEISGTVGQEVDVEIKVINNPGITSMQLMIGYDADVLELVGQKAGSNFFGMTYGPTTKNPFVINWVDALNPNNTNDGVFATLTFRIKEDVGAVMTPITITYKQENVFNSDWESVVFEVINGSVNVTTCNHETINKIRETIIEPTCEKQGRYEMISYCADCTAEVERIAYDIDALGHSYVTTQENYIYPTCTTDGGYDEVVACTRCNSRTSKHIILPKIGPEPGEPVIENRTPAACINGGSYDKVVYCTICDEELSRETIIIEALGHTSGQVVIENKKDASCTKDGSYDKVTYCIVCDEELSRETVVVKALGHTASEAVTENRVAATCTKDGSYDLVVYCTVCDYEISRETIKVDAIGHTAGEYVLENEIAPTCTKDGSYDKVSYCTVCDAEISRQTVVLKALGHTPSEEAIENRVAPTCTKTGSYDKVVYCEVCIYEISREKVVVDALGHTEDKPVIENEKDASCTQKGSYDLVSYCTVCKEVANKQTVEIPEKGHVKGKTVKENEIDATCTVDGSYDLVTYCDVCNEVIATNTVAIKASGHVTGATVIENRIEPSCTNNGSYDVVSYCAVCGQELTRKTEIIKAKGHVAGEEIIENRVNPTCTVDGSYDEVAYCAVCSGEVSREKVIIDALGHIAGEAGIENKVDASCTKEGSHDLVAYCTVCKAEVSRKTVITDALGHTAGESVIENRVEPGCSTKGSYDEVVYCTVCKDEISRKQVIISALGHTPGEIQIVNVVPAQCTTPASYDKVVYCTVCEAELSRETIYGSYGHKLDADGKCSICNKMIAEPMFFVTSGSAIKGKEFTVDVVVKNNPGITSMKLAIGYDAEILELVDCTDAMFANMSFSPITGEPFIINWVDTINPNNAFNGTIVTLKFRVKDNAEKGITQITVGYDPEDVYDSDYENVMFETNDAIIDIKESIPGDANGDGIINNKDLGILMQHLNSWNISIDLVAADVNGDGKVNNKDYGLLMQYLNGWEVEFTI